MTEKDRTELARIGIWMRLLGQHLPVKEMRLRMAKLLQEEGHPLAHLFEETIELSAIPWRIELKRVGGRPAKDVPQGELLTTLHGDRAGEARRGKRPEGSISREASHIRQVA